MKKIKLFFKYFTITTVSLIVIFLGTIYVGHKYIFKDEKSEISTLKDIKSGGMCFGVNCNPQPKTEVEYINLFANQIKNYSKIAPKLWPNNKEVNQYALVESIETKKYWLINPNGNVQELSQQKIDSILPNRPKFNVGFLPFESENKQGIYLALSTEDLTNVLTFQKYFHLGTYDLFITYSHELFHILNQDKNQDWKKSDEINNKDRFVDVKNIKARSKRNLLYSLVLDAVSETDSLMKIQKTLQLVSNFNDFKKTELNDYKNNLFFDRVEGSAFYYELISCLYVGYPNTVKSEDSLYKSLSLMASKLDRYDDGIIGTETYWINGWTGVLLDQLNKQNTDQWKLELMSNPNNNSLEILANQFSDNSIIKPAPLKISKEREKKVKEIIENNENNLSNVFRFLYEIFF
ncbi:hypothetical protein [Chishuiella sp.]|uniref:hypothetical protein n=1 Tax=Chishuiella sp. TaxID=1969467 RepID=UPI0028ABD349|nr:hypothetical protein [Chishuiella sp.]